MRKAVQHLRSCDPVLAGIIDSVGPYKPQYKDPDFEALVRSIVYQQLSGKAALTIYNRFEAIARKRGVLQPRAVMSLTHDQMRACGLSNGKACYIRDLAEKTVAKHVRFDALPTLCDEDVIAHLVQVKGIGVWTAQMFLLFALRRPNVLPTGDLGIRAAMKRAYGLDELPLPEEMMRISAPWTPWRSVATWYLWRSLDGPAAL